LCSSPSSSLPPRAATKHVSKTLSSQLLHASHRSGASSAMLSRALHLNLSSSRDQTPASASSSAVSSTSNRRSMSPAYCKGLFPSPILGAESVIAKELADQYTSEQHGVGMRIEQRGHGIMCVCHDLSLAQTPRVSCLCLVYDTKEWEWCGQVCCSDHGRWFGSTLPQNCSP
jgi:hypothetical protein